MARRYDAVVICATPRSGSTLLCEMLASTGAAGRPRSWFHRPSPAAWAAALDLPPPGPEAGALRGLLEAIVRAGTAGTGIFGLRLMRSSLEFLSDQLDRLYPGLPDDAARLGAAFGRVLYVHLGRGDKVAQAVSLVKAGQTGLWHVAGDGTELERQAPPRPPVYDPGLIAARLAELTAHDAAWERWFAEQRIAPVRVRYEALAADPAASVARILQAVGADPAAASGAIPPVARMADDVSRDWIARFRAEGRDI